NTAETGPFARARGLRCAWSPRQGGGRPMRHRTFAHVVVIGITAGLAAPGRAEFARTLTLTPLATERDAPRAVKGEIIELERQVEANPKDRAARLALVRALI